VEKEQSMSAAGQAWYPTKVRPFAEGADSAYRLALRGRGDALSGEFAELAMRVFGPALSATLDPQEAGA